MAPDGKEDERKARRRSRELRRGRFAKSDTASRMPERAAPLAARAGGRECRVAGRSDAVPPARKTDAAGAFPGKAPRAMAWRLISLARRSRLTGNAGAAERCAVRLALGRGGEHG
jgi:hypothetical protein